MQEINRAIEEISDIHKQIVTNSQFRGFGPFIIVLTGIMAFVFLLLQLIRPEIFAPNPEFFLGTWIVIAIISVILIGTELYRRSRLYHGSLASSMIANVIENFMPVGAAGAVIGFVILQNAPEITWILPGTWQILMSLAVFSSARFLPKMIISVAVWYFILGAIILILTNKSQILAPWSMGIAFVGGQLLMASILSTSIEQKND